MGKVRVCGRDRGAFCKKCGREIHKGEMFREGETRGATLCRECYVDAHGEPLIPS